MNAGDDFRVFGTDPRELMAPDDEHQGGEQHDAAAHGEGGPRRSLGPDAVLGADEVPDAGGGGD